MASNSGLEQYESDWESFWVTLDLLFLSRPNDYRRTIDTSSEIPYDLPDIDHLWSDITRDMRSTDAWNTVKEYLEQESYGNSGDRTDQEITPTGEYLLREMTLIRDDIIATLESEFQMELPIREVVNFTPRQTIDMSQEVDGDDFKNHISDVETFKQSLENFIGGKSNWLDRLLDLLNELIDLVT